MIESALADRQILYFFRSDGCEACAAAEPEVAKFIAAHPTVTVLSFNAFGPYPEKLGIKVKATPTYVLRRGDSMMKIEGALRVKDLERLVKKAGGTL